MDLPHWPGVLQINAHTGSPSERSAIDPQAIKWALKTELGRLEHRRRPQPPPDSKNWRDPQVGWGLVIAEDAEVPEPLHRLLDERSTQSSRAPVLRYSPRPAMRGYLQRNGKSLPISTSRRGSGTDAIPKYLLIYGTPTEIPWEVQYHLNAVCSVGRLTLKGQFLQNYVDALLNNWVNSEVRSDSAVLWSVEHDPADMMTGLMREAIAQPIFERIQNDTDFAPNSELLALGSQPPTTEQLTLALASRRPAIVITTSHGQTGPLNDIPQMTADLGLLVDTNLQLLRPQSLLEQWQPDGAIWYAHACCSAGCDSQSLFDGIAAPGTEVDAILKALVAIGARTSPFPEALLGAKKPLRAFVGHVEPTFDWVLRHPLTGRHQTSAIVAALYERLLLPSPLGYALHPIYEQLAGIYSEYDRLLDRYNADPNNATAVLYHAMIARDIQSLVVLGDPTAMLPP